MNSSYKIGSFSQINKKGEIGKIGKNIGRKKKIDDEKINNWKSLQYLSLGYYFLTPLLFGIVIGVSFDSLFNSKPLFILIFIFLGTIGSFYNLYKTIKQ